MTDPTLRTGGDTTATFTTIDGHVDPHAPEARAARGAALLDAQRPGWASEIDPETLDVSTQCNCVLGQLYRRVARPRDPYEAGLAFLCESSDQYDRRHWAVWHGFHSHGVREAEDYEDLTRAWRAEVAERVGSPDGPTDPSATNLPTPVRYNHPPMRVRCAQCGTRFVGATTPCPRCRPEEIRPQPRKQRPPVRCEVGAMDADAVLAPFGVGL